MTEPLSTSERSCRACGGPGVGSFYSVKGVPANSVVLLPTRDAALAYPKGDIDLVFCARCGFVANAAFDPGKAVYSEHYEETQAYSPTFNAFQERLVRGLIERCDIRGREVIEVGCGKGEFLTLLCRIGGNRGIGFDPSFDPARVDLADAQVTFVRDFYSTQHAVQRADLVCCKMTLEHIGAPAQLTALLATPLRDGGLLFVQVPNAERILRDVAFWDIYYEHCAYYARVALRGLLARSGLRPVDCWLDYDEQYLLAVAVKDSGVAKEANSGRGEIEGLGRMVDRFAVLAKEQIEKWRSAVAQMARGGRRVVLWGGGSKAVALLTTLNLDDEIAYAVDINPHRQGTFLAGTGHAVVSPARLIDEPPDTVVVLNPVYRREIERDLAGMGLTPEVVVLV